MLRFFILFLLLSCSGIVLAENACNDARYLELKNKSINLRTTEESKYFNEYNTQCEQSQTSVKSDSTVMKPKHNWVLFGIALAIIPIVVTFAILSNSNH